MRSDYGIVGCHVGIVWIFTVFLVEIMQELLEISGGLDCMELKMNEAGPYASTIPHLVYIAFQMMFAMITPALITGSLVGRVKFKALFLFIMFWSVIVYYPMAHMVWGQGGFLAEIGSVDFAGGKMWYISVPVSKCIGIFHYPWQAKRI